MRFAFATDNIVKASRRFEKKTRIENAKIVAFRRIQCGIDRWESCLFVYCWMILFSFRWLRIRHGCCCGCCCCLKANKIWLHCKTIIRPIICAVRFDVFFILSASQMAAASNRIKSILVRARNQNHKIIINRIESICAQRHHFPLHFLSSLFLRAIIWPHLKQRRSRHCWVVYVAS